MKIRLDFKNAGVLYLAWILWFLLVMLFGPLFIPLNSDSTALSLLAYGLLELLLVVPCILYYLLAKAKPAYILGPRPTLGQCACVAILAIAAQPALMFLALWGQGIVVLLGGHPLPTEIPVASNLWELVLGFLCIGVTAAVAEEPMFRGIQFNALSGAMGTKAAIYLSALFFALAHGSLEGLPALFVAGILLGVLRWRTGSLYLPMLFHAVYNSAALAMEYLFRWLSKTLPEEVLAAQEVELLAADYFILGLQWFFLSVPFILLMALMLLLLFRATPQEHKLSGTPWLRSELLPYHWVGWAAAIALSVGIIGAMALMNFAAIPA